MKKGYCNEFLEIASIGHTKAYLAATLMSKSIAEKASGWVKSVGDVFIYVLEGLLNIEYKDLKQSRVTVGRNEFILLPKGSEYLIFADEMTIYIAIIDESSI